MPNNFGRLFQDEFHFSYVPFEKALNIILKFNSMTIRRELKIFSIISITARQSIRCKVNFVVDKYIFRSQSEEFEFPFALK